MLITALESSRTQDMQLVLGPVRVPPLAVDGGVFAAPAKSAPMGVEGNIAAGRFSILSDLEETVARQISPCGVAERLIAQQGGQCAAAEQHLGRGGRCLCCWSLCCAHLTSCQAGRDAKHGQAAPARVQQRIRRVDGQRLN